MMPERFAESRSITGSTTFNLVNERRKSLPEGDTSSVIRAISYTDDGEERDVEFFDSEFCLCRSRKALVTEHDFEKLSNTVLQRGELLATLEWRQDAPADAICGMCERPINEGNNSNASHD